MTTHTIPAALTATLLQSGAETVSVEVPAGGFLGFSDGGVMMYPIAFSALVVLVLAAWSGWRLRRGAPRVDATVEAAVDGVLFWGAYALLLGVLGTVIGIAVAAQAVEMAGEVHTTLVWGGIKVALITTIWGAVILGAAALLWFLLRARCRTLLARTV